MNRADFSLPVLYWAPCTNRIVKVRFGDGGRQENPVIDSVLGGDELRRTVDELESGVLALYREPTRLGLSGMCGGMISTEQCYMIGRRVDMCTSEVLERLGTDDGHVKSLRCRAL